MISSNTVIYINCLFLSQINSYKSHLRRKHGNINLKLAKTPDIDNMDIENQNHPMHEGGHENVGDEMDVIAQPEEDPIQAMRNLNAKFILKTKETNMLTQKCVDNIVDDSTELVRGTVKALKSGLQSCLENSGLNFDAVPGLNEIFEDNNPISNPFEHVSTQHKQNAYFKSNFGLVVSFNYIKFKFNILVHVAVV